MTTEQMYELRSLENKQLRKVIDKLFKENKELKEKLEEK